ncbi:ubiquitin-conjugating enzyme E2 D4-like [Amphiura filiformis]|uniref:ubiquitin-conjugating enzyme E2 D4-like n=1 Tax=Amphiura filiformis TaxID=82378 RepID=UPI003B21E9B6
MTMSSESCFEYEPWLLRIKKELLGLNANPSERYSGVGPRADKWYDWEATILGPYTSPYEGGIFHIGIKLPKEYPFKPPQVIFETKIYHPNIGVDGVFDFAIVGSRWTPALSISKVLNTIWDLLCEPSTDKPIRPDVAYQLTTNPTAFRKTAARNTRLYATSSLPDSPPPQMRLPIIAGSKTKYVALTPLHPIPKPKPKETPPVISAVTGHPPTGIAKSQLQMKQIHAQAMGLNVTNNNLEPKKGLPHCYFF